MGLVAPSHARTRDLFEAASAVNRFRQVSRSGAGVNRHPQAVRTHQLRSCFVHDLCGRRMWGGTKHNGVHYHCRTSEKNHRHQPWYATHARHVMLREDLVTTLLGQFFEPSGDADFDLAWREGLQCRFRTMVAEQRI